MVRMVKLKRKRSYIKEIKGPLAQRVVKAMSRMKEGAPSAESVQKKFAGMQSTSRKIARAGDGILGTLPFSRSVAKGDDSFIREIKDTEVN